MTITPAERAFFDQYDAHVAQIVRTHGVFIQSVSGHVPVHESPCFAYTVGLHGIGHPELLVFELAQSDAARVLNALAARVRGGESLLPGRAVEVEEWPRRAVLERVPNSWEIAFQANDHYGLPPFAAVELLQVTYSDSRGCFPWDDGYDLPAWTQPRPGEFRA